ncbi:MAG: type II secretion system F family protein [Azonexus sp.]|nr:type II secretion system F family protein [Azonexus sp.]
MVILGIALYLLALLLIVAAVLSFRSGERAAIRSRISGRFQEISFDQIDSGTPKTSPLRGNLYNRWLWRSGIQLSRPRIVLFSVGLIAGLALVWQFAGAFADLVAISILIVIFVVWPNYQYRKRLTAMAAQIPLFLDQVVRGLATGRNLDGALRLATEETRAPLVEVMTRVQQAVDLGADIGEALRDAASLYNLRELYFIAMAVQIAHNYGSSPKEMLESAAKLVRHREQAQRELRAMTGETRISAWTLSILPSSVALYMLAVNPGYLNSMWLDPGGRIVLLMSLALQITGAFILWRMVKSV